nr:hypothetical protein [Kineococcus indalonis]
MNDTIGLSTILLASMVSFPSVTSTTASTVPACPAPNSSTTSRRSRTVRPSALRPNTRWPGFVHVGSNTRSATRYRPDAGTGSS